ncbi:B3 domain-containing protein rem16 [Thalictrum thalictroides]|uniref:B3 domain-containing protein rem16 n=1 Tax=Thalictrum thalictroides TaxID=46969 RepID=A0A7J6VGV3_THATH|nr:B3 domain-containing protein rem16 [Thalictrum thalictroides]
MEKDCECCKQWKKHLFWTGNDPPTPVHFFFKMLMDGFQEKLAIPRKFVSKFRSKLPETVVLEGPSGKATNIGLTRTEDEVYFGHGWSQFASNHSLEKLDLLVFRFNERDICFQVMFFDKTACEKEGVHVACLRESDRPGLHTNGTQSVQINKVAENVVIKSYNQDSTSDALSIENSDDDSDSIDSYYVPSSESSDDGSDSSSVKGQKRENTFTARHGYPISSCVRKNPRQNSPVKKNRNGANKKSQKDLNKVSISRNKDRVRQAELSFKGKSGLNPTNLGANTRKLSYYRYFQSKRRPVTVEEQQLALKKARAWADSSTKPHFIKVMKQSNVRVRFFMTLPRKFLIENFSQVPEIGQLRVTGKAKTWIVTILAKGLDNIQPGISGGWANFVMGNNLEKGDACLFELDNINPICESVMKFDVTIFRVVDKIVPLKRIPVKSPL